jgi:hypothetical protein
VSATFDVEVRVADEEKRKAEYVAVERELERLEELYRPSLQINSTSVEFGNVSSVEG